MNWNAVDFASVYAEMLRSRGLSACVWVNKKCVYVLTPGGWSA
jgi:hypothetical protein